MFVDVAVPLCAAASLSNSDRVIRFSVAFVPAHSVGVQSQSRHCGASP